MTAASSVDENGVVTVADGASFDAETEGSIDITVTATSTDGSTSTETFTISRFRRGRERCLRGHRHGCLGQHDCRRRNGRHPGRRDRTLATDADATDSVSYTVDDSRFTVDENGVVTVADGASFDAETEGSIDITVTATSTDGSTSTETFTISVSDVDMTSDVSAVTDTDASDNTIAEDATAGTQVGVTALGHRCRCDGHGLLHRRRQPLRSRRATVWSPLPTAQASTPRPRVPSTSR